MFESVKSTILLVGLRDLELDELCEDCLVEVDREGEERFGCDIECLLRSGGARQLVLDLGVAS